MQPSQQQLARALYHDHLTGAEERRGARQLLSRHRTVRRAGQAQRRLRRATQHALRLQARLEP
jgi:hypothetical protein